jgi:hypothetical protein
VDLATYYHFMRFLQAVIECMTNTWQRLRQILGLRPHRPHSSAAAPDASDALRAEMRARLINDALAAEEWDEEK